LRLRLPGASDVCSEGCGERQLPVGLLAAGTFETRLGSSSYAVAGQGDRAVRRVTNADDVAQDQRWCCPSCFAAPAAIRCCEGVWGAIGRLAGGWAGVNERQYPSESIPQSPNPPGAAPGQPLGGARWCGSARIRSLRGRCRSRLSVGRGRDLWTRPGRARPVSLRFRLPSGDSTGAESLFVSRIRRCGCLPWGGSILGRFVLTRGR